MFEFFGNIFYLSMLSLVLIIMYVVTKNSWSKEILSKNSNALIWNNSFIILGIILVASMFFIFSWFAGVVTVIFAIIVYIIAARKMAAQIEATIFNSTKKKDAQQ